MLRRDASKSISFCGDFSQRNSLRVGGVFLPFLVLMLFATPQLALGQSLAVTVHPRTLSIAEGGSDTYTVVLDAEPAEDVTLTVVGAMTEGGDITVSSETDTTADDTSVVLTFTVRSEPSEPGNINRYWATAQTVTVNTVEDDDAASETMTLTHTATVGEDAASVSRVSVRVTVNDIDVDDRGVTVAPTTLEVDEAGDSVMYSVSLGTRPTAPVTVDVGGASGEVAVSPSRLIFMPEEWADTQELEVKVFAGEDADAVNDEATIKHTVRGGDYTGQFASSVVVTVDDNDDPVSATVSPNELTVAVGARGTYAVQLSAQPTRTVTIRVSETSDHVTVSPSTLSFTTSNWRAKAVTVNVRSGATNGDTAEITHTIETTAMEYESVTVDPFTVTFSDEEQRVTLRPSGTLTVDEGATRTYRVTLSPALGTGDTATVTIAGFSGSDLDVSPSTPLQFTEETTFHDVMVTANEDADAVEDTVTLTHSIGDAIVRGGVLQVRVRENDRRGVTVTPTSLEVNEGSDGTYTVNLDSEPTGDVTVTVSGASGDVTVDPSQLNFSASDWFEAKPITVSTAHDDDGVADPNVTLRHTVRGADYGGIRVDNVTVTVEEDEERGITVDMAELTIAEGATGKYNVALMSQPTGTVTVMVRGQSGDVTATPSRLIFTTSNWDDSREVEVTVGEDADGEIDAEVELTHVASGGGYNGVTGGMVTVKSTENDIKGVTATPRSFTVKEGSSAISYNVSLKTEPKGPVTVAITLQSEPDETENIDSLVVSPMSLRFTAGNWYIPQVVSVRAAEDSDSVEGTVTLTHTASGGGYDELTALPVMIEIDDNDEAGLTVSSTSLQIAEGSRKTYTVVLNTEPSQTVMVTVNSPSGVSATPASLDFTAGNWNVPRTVTVHATDNDIEETQDETGNITHTVTGYSVVGPVPQVVVTIKDNDTPGVVIDPTSLTITEGESDTYTVVLTKRPTATVTVAIEISGPAGDVRINGRTTRTLSFSTSSWNSEQTVTVSVSEDDDAVPDVGVMLSHKVTGADEYEALAATRVSEVEVTPKEDDTRGVTVNPTMLTIAAGVSGTYRVRLNTEPTDDVTIEVNSPPEEVTVTGSPMVFTTGNWRTDQTVTVMVSEDAGGEEPKSVMLTHSASGGDYLGVEPASVTVTIPVEGTPSAPTRLTATGGDRQVTLNWGAPASDGGTPIVRYQYRVQQSGRGFTSWATVPGGARATSYIVTGLENGTSNTFEVRAVNGVGSGQVATAEATLAESAPGAPANLTATGGDEQVALSWGAPADGGSQIIRYEYRFAAAGETYGDWEPVSGGGNARSHTETGLTNGTEYGFQVRAVNGIGEGPHAEASATPGRVPSMPTGLTAGAESETITVMWGMPADNGGSAITGYEVRYRMSGGAWRNWMAVEGGASATSYTIMGLTNGIGYEIAVRAVNGIGAGDAAITEATPMEALVFAHFANGKSGEMTNISDLVLVNVETSAVNVAIYFYGKDGGMIAADSLVDMTGDMEPTGDGGVTVAIVGQGETTVSTNGEGELATGSVKVFATGRIGGVLRFDISMIGVAGVGASAPVSDAIFPVRRVEGGINTGVAIRNLDSEPTDVTCHLMQGGRRLSGSGVTGELPAGGQVALFIDQIFGTARTSDFSGSVRCMAAEGGMFTAVALEMDGPNQILTTLPVVPVDEEAADDGESMLNFAHFANGDFGGFPTSSDLVFVNVANTAVAPAIYFYDRDGNMIDADTVVDVMMEGIDFADDGALTVMEEIPPLGEMTISTTGMGDDVVGSVRVVSDGPIGGVLRFVTSNIGVAGVGASEAVNAAIFPARYMENGINTGAAIRNLESERMTVNCKLMQGGRMVDEEDIPLAANAQNSQFITEVFDEIMDSGMSEFVGSVHCSAPEGMMFTGVALEMDFINRVFTTLPVVPVQ